TNIPCVTGSCDATLGQLCSSEAPGHAAMAMLDPSCTPSDGNSCLLSTTEHCIAYPVVKFDQKIPLIGYNFWDPCQAQLMMRPLSTSATATDAVYTIPVSGVDANGEPANDDTEACRSSPDGVRLATAGIRGPSTATFELGGDQRPALP